MLNMLSWGLTAHLYGKMLIQGRSWNTDLLEDCLKWLVLCLFWNVGESWKLVWIAVRQVGKELLRFFLVGGINSVFCRLNKDPCGTWPRLGSATSFLEMPPQDLCAACG